MADDRMGLSELDLQSFTANFPGMAYRLRQNRPGVYSFDYISDKCLLFFGHTAAAIIKDSSLVFAGISEPERTELHQVLHQSALGLTPFRHEHLLISPDGRSLWLQHSAMPHKNPDGELVWDGVALDITERKVAEEALRLSEETLKKAQRVCKMTSWRISLAEKGGPHPESEFWYFGSDDGPRHISYAELSGFIHPDDRQFFDDAMAQAKREEKGFELELRTRDAAGQPTWCHLVADVVRDANGDFVELIGTMRDITETKAAEKKRRSQRELEEQRYRSVVEDQTEIISRIAPDGTLLLVNEAFCRFFNKDRQHFIGTSWKPIAYAPDIAVIDQQLRLLSLANPVIVVENRVYRRDGCLRWMQFINRGIFNTDNRLTEIQCVGRDITELKETQASLQQRDAELRLKNTKLAKLNIALEVVIDQKDEQLEHLRADIMQHYNQFVRPHVQELRDSCRDLQTIQYLKLIEQGMQQMLSPFSRKMLASELNFTPMEHKIVSLIVSGMSNTALAEELHISPHTVKYHRKNIRTKLGILNKKINLRSYLLQLSQ